MAPASLAELKSLSHRQRQELCKVNSLKAGGKSEALIASLAEFYGFSNDDVDEQPAPAPAKPATKKRSAPGKAPATVNNVVEPAQGRQSVAAQTPAKVQEKIVYSTSPGTKATVAQLVSTIKDLQASVSTLKAAAAAPRSPALKEAKVLSLVKTEVAACRKSMVDELSQRFGPISTKLTQLEQDVKGGKAAQKEDVEQLRARLSSALEVAEEEKKALEESFNHLRDDLVARLAALQQPSGKVVPSPSSTPAPPAPAPAAPAPAPAPAVTAAPSPRRVSWAADLDAPPTRSVAFPSPGSPAPIASSTPRKSSLAKPKPASTPFKDAPAAVGSAPASALPSHMLATAASAAKRSPRSPRVSAPAQVQTQPMSPAGPPPPASLGKRARHSDASELSVELAALDSPAAMARSRTTTSSSDGSSRSVVSPGRRLSEILAASADDHHARKRQRVSTSTVVDNGEEDQQSDADEQDEAFEDSFEEPQEEAGDNSFAEESFISNEEEENSVRDFLLPTKTGDEEPTALKPQPQPKHAQVQQPSVHDPAFFAVPPVSPAGSNRRATLGTPAKENNAPASARKSFPAQLPVAFVSPYKASSASAPASPSAKKATTPGFSFGTPGTIANRRITIGPAASARKATPVRGTPYSAKKAAPAPASASRRGSQAVTPQASRTLYGSERIVPSSVASAATSAAQTAWEGEDDEGGAYTEESRFGEAPTDGFVSLQASPQKGLRTFPGMGTPKKGLFSFA
ncbi:hypothetical protein JCM10213_006356 [Rhodosporidiobolus nylandii]